MGAFLVLKEKIMKEVIAGFLYFIVIVFVFTYPMMLLWNWLMPFVFNLPTLGFWQTLGLMILCNGLFNSGSK